jgi:hypothetical protein
MRAPLLLTLTLASSTALANAPDARQRAFNVAVRSRALSGLLPLARSRGAGAETAFLGDQQVVVRHPRALWPMLRSHQALYKMASELNFAEAVLPATSKLTPNGPVMVTEHAGARFQAAIDAPPRARDQLPERSRVLGALLHLLSDHIDGSIRNVMLSPAGELRLIDLDATNGRGPKNPIRSTFYPGEPLAYGGAQNAFSQLPPAAQRLVTHLADSPVATLMNEYGYTWPEARDVAGRARQIRRVGLTAAVAMVAGGRRSPTLDFVR